jgi:hypothetical protein
MPITFFEQDINLVSYPHSDPMVIEANIQGWTNGNILVDTGSSTNMILSNTFDRMNIDRNFLQLVEIPLIGFGGKKVNTLGKIPLPVSFVDLTNPRIENITFDVVEMNYPYLAIFGRGFLNKFEAVVHQLYLCMKIPAAKGVITVHGNQELARDIEQGVALGQRNVYHLKADTQPPPIKRAQKRQRKDKFEQDYQVKKVLLDKHMLDKLVRTVQLSMNRKRRSSLNFFCKNKDVFA